MNLNDDTFLDDVFTKLTEELNRNVSKLGSTPWAYQLPLAPERGVQSVTGARSRALVRRAHAEDFIALEALGRVRLSNQTRKAEIKRLKRKYKKRKKYTLRYGRKHNKQKAKTKKEYNNRRWEKAPLERIRYSYRKPCLITQEEWDRCIQPVWSRYDRKYLKIKCSAPKMTIHNVVIVYHPPKERYARKPSPPRVIYDGFSQAVHDSMFSTG